MLFANPLKVIRVVSWILIAALIFYVIWIVGINIYSFIEFGPEQVVKKFTALSENPTEKVTEEEKAQLAQITESSWFNSWSNANNLKTLREVAQNNPIQIGEIQYQGSQKQNATVELTFTNTYTNPNSKKAKLYLQRSGQWYLMGNRWRIFDIDMPQKDNPVSNIQDGALDLGDKVRDALDNLIGGDKKNR